MASSRKSLSAEDLAARVAATVARHVAPGARLCVALSGGVDSVVLLHLLVGLQDTLSIALRAAHVHHGLNAAADDWQAFCTALCGRLDVPFEYFRVSLPAAPVRGIEAAARAARYEALARSGAEWLVLGHHRDDQAETVLFKLLRGSGLKGLAGIAEAERRADGLALLRPLLGVGRADILEYARSHRLAWVEDDSNADQRFARNFLRTAVLPALQERFPAATTAISRAADHLRESQLMLDQLAAIDAQAVTRGAAMQLDALVDLPEARVRNLLRWQLSALGMAAPDEPRLREAVRQLRGLGSDQPLQFPLGGAALCHYRGRLWLEAPSMTPVPGVPWCGESVLPWGNDTVSFAVVRGAGIDRALLPARSTRLDIRRSGDRMQLGPGRPHRSCKNLLQEAGIPPWLRDTLPVLRVGGVPVWIGGVGVAVEYACPPDAEGVMPLWSRVDGGISPRRAPA